MTATTSVWQSTAALDAAKGSLVAVRRVGSSTDGNVGAGIMFTGGPGSVGTTGRICGNAIDVG